MGGPIDMLVLLLKPSHITNLLQVAGLVGDNCQSPGSMGGIHPGIGLPLPSINSVITNIDMLLNILFHSPNGDLK